MVGSNGSIMFPGSPITDKDDRQTFDSGAKVTPSRNRETTQLRNYATGRIKQNGSE